MNIFPEINAWYWLGLALLLLILELVSFSGFLLWIGLSAGLVSIVFFIFSGLPITYQFLLFSVASLLGCIVWKYHLQRNPAPTNKLKLNRRNEQYIGRVFVLQEAIIDGRGKIRVDDSIWRVEGKDLPVGSKVRVIGVDGVVLRVVSAIE
jgi:membrane protein implicated in regulation of membrane protease activity